MANTTWNPSDKNANVSLSNGNLTTTGAANQQGSIRGVAGRTSGKCYWEVTLTTTGSGSGTGLANINAVLANLTTASAANSTGCAWINYSGAIYIDGSSVLAMGAVADGTVVCMALDIDNKRMWFRLGAAGQWNGSGTANPATNVGGLTVPFGAALAAYPLDLYAFPVAATSHTANFGDSVFTGAVPSGFTAGFPVSIAGINPPGGSKNAGLGGGIGGMGSNPIPPVSLYNILTGTFWGFSTLSDLLGSKTVFDFSLVPKGIYDIRNGSASILPVLLQGNTYNVGIGEIYRFFAHEEVGGNNVFRIYPSS